MSMLNCCLKGLAAIALLAASPVLIVFALPFGCGFGRDVLDATGPAPALAVTTGICLGALAWTRRRGRLIGPEALKRSVANGRGRSARQLS